MNFGFVFHMRYIFVTHFLSAKYVKNDLRKLSIDARLHSLLPVSCYQRFSSNITG